IAGGESLYTIARKYDVTTQAIVIANGLSSPDKIVVGQKVIIPGRSDLNPTAGAAPTQLASAPAPLGQTLPSTRPTNLATPVQQAAAPAPIAAPTPAPAPVVGGQHDAPIAAAKPAPAPTPAAEPAMSGSD